MKIKDGFMLHTVSGQTVVLPVSGDLDLNMMIKLNDTGRFLWEQLQTEKTMEQLVSAILETYDISEADAKAHVATFIKGLEKNGFLC